MASAQAFLTEKRAAFVLAALVAAAFWPVFSAGFSPWDDRLYLAENPLVRDGLSVTGAWRALTSPWENNWSPVFWIFLAAQASIGGADHPQIFHATSLLLCVANALLLRHWLLRLGLAAPAAFVAAAIFCLHPLRVEAVAWIAAQKHLLAGFWLLVALILYERGRRTGGWEVKLAAGVAYALSLMSAQIAVGLPVFLAFREACDPADDSTSRRWLTALGRAIPFFVVSAGAAAITLWVNWNPEAQTIPWFHHGWAHRLTHGLASFGWLTVDTLWPFRLACFYPWPAKAWLYATLGGALAAGGIFLFWRHRALPGIALAGLAGFLACFLPVSGLVDLPIEFTADRLSYVPGFFLALALGALLDAARRRGSSWPLYAGMVWAVALIPVTYRQAGYWKDEKSLVARTLAEYPASIPAQINAATLAGLEGRREESLAQLRRIREKNPFHEVVWSNEMTLLREMNRMDEALETGALAVIRIPNSPVLQLQHGLNLEAAGRKPEALVSLRRSQELRPRSVEPTFYLARALVHAGRSKEAQPLLDRLERAMGGMPDYWILRAEACDVDGNVQGAQMARERAEDLKSRQ